MTPFGRRFSKPAGAQRRPEITPGYDSGAPCVDGAELSLAQRRPEITPGYDLHRTRRTQPAGRPLNEGRRLLPATTTGTPGSSSGRRATLNEGRRLPPATTRWQRVHSGGGYTAHEGRRLHPATTLRSLSLFVTNKERSTKAGDYPRLRRERERARRPGGDSLNEGRRLPPATTGSNISRTVGGGIHAQRRPEITPGYDAATSFT